MKTLKCQAKNPATCRYHSPQFSTIMKSNLDTKTVALENFERKIAKDPESINYDEYSMYKFEHRQAEEDYYATSEGLNVLQKRIDSTPESEEKTLLEYLYSRSSVQMEINEKRQKIDEDNGGPLVPYEKQNEVMFSSIDPLATPSDSLYPVTTGSKYDRSLTTADIKKNVTNDIRQAQKDGWISPHLKFKITKQRDRIDVIIQNVPDEQRYEEYALEEARREGRGRRPRRNDETKQSQMLDRRVGDILNQYNTRTGDYLESNTLHTNFYGFVRYEETYEAEERKEKEAAAKARRAK